MGDTKSRVTIMPRQLRT